jgi:hypothetical protein
LKVFEWIYEHVDTPYTPEEALRTTYSAIRYKRLQTGVLQILLQILLSLDLLLTLQYLITSLDFDLLGRQISFDRSHTFQMKREVDSRAIFACRYKFLDRPYFLVVKREVDRRALLDAVRPRLGGTLDVESGTSAWCELRL